MILQIAVVVSLQILTVLATPKAETCEIPINTDMDDDRQQPLILDKRKEVIFPQELKITIRMGTEVEFHCIKDTLCIDGRSMKAKFAIAHCLGNNSFKIDGHNMQFSSLTCCVDTGIIARWANHSIGTFEIGFMVRESPEKFSRVIEGYFDKKSQNTLYTKIKMYSSFRGPVKSKGTKRRRGCKNDMFPVKHKGTKRRSGWKNDLFTVAVNKLFTIERQTITINELLGLPADSKTCIQDRYNYYLAGGHLAAKADFIFGIHQQATFYHLNAAPMWQIINNGNWKILEDDVRSFVQDKIHNLSISVYTGTHGVSALKRCKESIPRDQIELYLGEYKQVPVPKFVWKVIYEETSQRGTAFLVVNDPYLTENDKRSEEYNICFNVCGRKQITWLRWRPGNLPQGYVYCCDVNEFRTVVTTLPDFIVNGLLT